LFTELFYRGAKTKYIYSEIMQLNKNKTKILLHTYFTGDGYKHNNYQEVTTVSRQLAYQVRELIIDNGYFPSLKFRKNRCGNNEYYISFSNCNEKAYRLRTKYNKKYIFNKVTKINKYITNRTKVYNLKVKWDETFCTFYHCVHNCHRIGQTSKVTIISLIANNTVDERWEKLIEKKRDIAEQILGDKTMVVDKQMVLEFLDENIGNQSSQKW